MSKLLIRVDNHDQPYTVSEMRKRLAQVLSKLNGDQEVVFTFIANLENYQPKRHLTMPAILGTPYGLSKDEMLPAGLQAFYGELARPEND